MATDDLPLKPGLVTTRAAIAAAYGGSLQGGIVPADEAKKVFLFSDKKESGQHGYTFDGWAESDELGPLFHYTGTGSVGDQVLTGYNGSVLKHVEMGRELHLFMSEPSITPGTDAKQQRYVGQMIVDSIKPAIERWNNDRNGNRRQVWVFRLRPVDEAQTEILVRDFVPAADKDDAELVPAETSAELVEAEQHATDQTTANGSAEPKDVVRREGKLSEAYKAFLTAQGHEVLRYQITIAGSRGALLTDLYDKTAHVLYEVKGKNRRNDVRMAIGQLMDYRRHIKKPGLKLAILLPSLPSQDLQDLISNVGISLVVQDGTGFHGFPVD
ncbi:hypothetical protein ABZW30_28970 [Kitasatospora sp. NPDC004669]|uniref:hypothetical protein n=1 Tax=Kitasatospora sp. NPDC004669 TaxID=3154555 RepID=UPI00339DEDAB